jgi:hypothetical protein
MNFADGSRRTVSQLNAGIHDRRHSEQSEESMFRRQILRFALDDLLANRPKFVSGRRVSDAGSPATLPEKTPVGPACNWKIIPARALLIACALILGCTSSKPSRPPVQNAETSSLTAPISNTDPCAMQMHDICGGFLLFYASQNRLPNQLSELYSTEVVAKEIRFVCPVSQQPYIYNPNGIFLPDQNARVILYDATAAHSGFRWAISIHEPRPGQPLIAKVLALPDQFFMLQ